ncbi:uncharacterized protein LOC106012759 [Aplysia californica]|uniref:Uncharacterized protein LOC106012759 n=1 Tax=Aplysia californica TaxID=6500 RepID=A0ABM1A710_APLCA|nr:uncharacterized protein LOC106012759 [Aplysia californica]
MQQQQGEDDDHGLSNLGTRQILNWSPSDISMEALSRALGEKLLVAKKNISKEVRFKPTCQTPEQIAGSNCSKDGCLRTELPENFRDRVKQLVGNPKFQLSPQYKEAMAEMASQIEGRYEIILLTAASSNHFFESQALMKNLHTYVFPRLRNFTLIFYDIGLSEEEHLQMKKYCQCQVVKFPFHLFPEFVRNLKCYSWKPLMIKAHIPQSKLVVWMDASVRFRPDPQLLPRLLQQAQDRGVQMGGSGADSPYRTDVAMYHFFGDEPCAYLGLSQAKATFGVFHREPFVDKAVLEPWCACAVKKNCICPSDRHGCAESKAAVLSFRNRSGPLRLGLCHRYDQSAISTILHKLYQGYFRFVLIDILKFIQILRKTTENYFPVS